MDSNKTGRSAPRQWLAFLVLVTVPLAGAADEKKSPSSPSPRANYKAPRTSAPAHVAPRPAPHSQTSAPRQGSGVPRSTTQGSTGTASKAGGFTAAGHVTPGTLRPMARPSMQTPSAHMMPGSLGHTVSLRNGGTATMSPSGNIRSVQSSGMTINHGAQGQRQIVTERNGQRLVSSGPNQGYSQHDYVTRNGQTYVQRTYVVNNVTYTRVYRSYTYSGVTYYNYVPVAYYRPRFYGWVYNPWAAPVYYSWGWYGAPWYASYGYYYAPAPVYASPSLWLTDYLLAENLKLAYQAQANANAASQAQANTQAYAPSATAPQPPQSDNVALTPEVKQAIAEEVKAQLAAEQAASAAPQPASLSQNQPPPALDPAHRVFVVASNITASSDAGQECTLTSGDIITRVTDAPNKDQKVTVLITTSKKADCAAGLMLAVPVQELQEMHNHFREQVDSGLKILADSKGQGGLPAAPDTHLVNGEVPEPTADPGIVAKLQSQQMEADKLEADVKKQTAQGARS